MPTIQPAQARLILALVLSLAWHLALLFLVQVRPVPRPQPSRILQVTLAERPAVARQRAEVAAASPPRPGSSAPASDVERHERPAVSSPPAAIPAAASPLPALDIPLLEDPTYYSAKQLDVHPAAASPIRPDYPDGSADSEGFVTLKLLIDESGTVREASVVDAQPPGVFEESALAAFRAARFLPGQRNGRPVKSRILIRVTYELVNRSLKND